MSVRGLSWQTFGLRLLAGLNQKSDPRALEVPELLRATDVQFDRIAGLTARLPYIADSNDIVGGGDLANCRRIVKNGSEWLLFTKDTLYSWSPELQKWSSRGTHLAIKQTEQSRFVNPQDQLDGDRAELDGMVVFAWTEGTTVYCAAVDKTTGAVMRSPTNMGGGDTINRPRLVALDTAILLFVNNDTTSLVDVTPIDPANPASIEPNATAIGAANHNDYYDACHIPGTDSAVMVQRLNPATSYAITTVTAAISQSVSVKVRPCDGPIAVSATPDGVSAQVIRGRPGVGTIRGDLITIATLADGAHIDTAVGTTFNPTNQIACAHRSTQDSGQYRCYAFWTYGEDTNTSVDWGTKSNWVDTGGNLGSQADFVDHVGVASRAFDHEGRVFVWLAFSALSAVTDNGAGTPSIFGTLQNTYFLYRDDAFLCAKAAANVAGGVRPSIGHLSGVQNIASNQYAWCGTERRRLELTGKVEPGYSARAPREIVVEFDSNEARRCARLGETLYISGAEILQYDGAQLVEAGFHVYPWFFDMAAAGAGGSMGAGVYAYKMTWRWDNARGERDRSTTASAGEVTCAANDEVAIDTFHSLNITHKTQSACAVELWRTPVNPTDDAPFYLATSPDPTVLAGDNKYLANDHTAMDTGSMFDSFSDDTLTTKEGFSENGGQLNNLSPPAATLIVATDTRLFLGGVSGDPHRVHYSKYREAGKVASWFGALAVDIPQAGGDMTGLALLNETPVVFRETAIYALDGQGFGNTGDGGNYVARMIAADVGAISQESIAVTDRGVVFKSSKGWMLLNRGWSVSYIGAPIADYDGETVYSVDVIEAQHQVRVLTASRMLVFDTYASDVYQRPTWSEWTISDGLHSCMFSGAHTYLTSTGPKTQATSYAAGATYGFDVELAWLKLDDLHGYGACDFFDVLGEFRSACSVRIRLARDYWRDGDGTYFQDKTHTPSLAAGKPLQLRHSPSIKQVTALRVRLTMTPSSSGEGLRLTGFLFKLGIIPGANRNLLTAEKQ